MEGEKNMKTYLITGGAGFIGSHLSEVLLKKGDRVMLKKIAVPTVIGVKNNNTTVNDIEKNAAKKPIDIIFPRIYFSVEVCASWNMISKSSL